MKYFTGVLTFFFVILFSPGLSSAALGPVYEFPYFYPAKVTFQNLPEGIEIIETANQPRRANQPYLVNRTEKPLYIVEENTSGVVFKNSELPEDLKPVFKMEKEYTSYWPGYGGDRPDNDPYVSEGSWIRMWNPEISVLSEPYLFGHINITKPVQKYSTGSIIPVTKGIKSPQFEEFILLAYYDNELLELEGQIEYVVIDYGIDEPISEFDLPYQDPIIQKASPFYGVDSGSNSKSFVNSSFYKFSEDAKTGYDDQVEIVNNRNFFKRSTYKVQQILNRVFKLPVGLFR